MKKGRVEYLGFIDVVRGNSTRLKNRLRLRGPFSLFSRLKILTKRTDTLVIMFKITYGLL